MQQKDISFKIGHVLIQVDNLKEGILKYQQMGFQVTPGGLPGKAHNALIYLKDGSFLELYCTNHGKLMNGILKLMVKLVGLSDRAYSKRLERCLPGRGKEELTDYALDSVPGSLYYANLERIRGNGLKISKPRAKSRVDCRGVRLKWNLSWPESAFLPFLMSEYQPSMEIGKEKTSHANGALGIRQIEIVTGQWDKTYRDYSRLLGNEPKVQRQPEGRSCLFTVQSTSIVLMEKGKDRTEKIQKVVLSAARQSEGSSRSTALPEFLVLD